MSSQGSQYFHTYARPDIWTEHGETVSLYDTDTSTSSDLTVIWQSVIPTGVQYEGVGARSYEGQAKAVVRVSDMAAHPGARSRITRNGVVWEIRFIDRKDEYTWVYHLSQPDEEDHMPQRIRR